MNNAAVEYHLLLWPAKNAPSLYYINRSLSSYDSSSIHVLYSSVCLYFYTSRLRDDYSDLEVNQGLLSFLANTSLSCCTVWKGKRRELVKSWGNLFLVSIRCAMECAAFQMRQYSCQLSRGVLISFFLSLVSADVSLLGQGFVGTLAADLGLSSSLSLEQQQGLLSSGEFGTKFEQSDREGRIIYWMFRDTRSMSLRPACLA